MTKTRIVLLCVTLALPAALGAEDGRTIKLFNGKDLSGFYTWLVDYKYSDPDRVFSVVEAIDGAPAIRISGEHWGGLLTRQEYSDYRLVAEFRWGNLTWAPRADKNRDSGILLHCQRPEGNYNKDFNGPWMHSIEFQIIEGGVGDIILVGSYDETGKRMLPKLTATARKEGNQNVYDPKAELREFEGGRVNWYGRDPNWKDTLGFRGKDDVESPWGQWNRAEIVCDGDTITYTVNGKLVNRGTRSSLKKGRILLQSEGAEIYFRKVELTPLR